VYTSVNQANYRRLTLVLHPKTSTYSSLPIYDSVEKRPKSFHIYGWRLIFYGSKPLAVYIFGSVFMKPFLYFMANPALGGPGGIPRPDGASDRFLGLWHAGPAFSAISSAGSEVTQTQHREFKWPTTLFVCNTTDICV
jgi:hypothetical protein